MRQSSFENFTGKRKTKIEHGYVQGMQIGQSFKLVQFPIFLSPHHGDEKSKLGVQVDNISVSENELTFTFLPASEHDSDLLSCNREHWQIDPVELVKTSPRTGLG